MSGEDLLDGMSATITIVTRDLSTCGVKAVPLPIKGGKKWPNLGLVILLRLGKVRHY